MFLLQILFNIFHFTIPCHSRISNMTWKAVIFGSLLMMYEASGNIGDYHSSSSAAFDEGNLESISRFYNIGIIKIPFSKASPCYYYILHPHLYRSKKFLLLIEIRKCQFTRIAEYANIRTHKKNCEHQCLSKCHTHPGNVYKCFFV